MLGLLGFGSGIGLMGVSELGVGPWDVLHQGLSELTGIPFGTVGILVGLPILAAWIPLRQRVGIGTVANTIVVGLVIDAVMWAIPDVEHLAGRWALLVAGIVVIGAGSGAYIGAGLGAGPRDGLMTGLVERGWGSVRVVRTGIEVSVLVLGWLLGGTVGIGTVLLAVTIGPLVQLFLGRLTLPPVLVEPPR